MNNKKLGYYSCAGKNFNSKIHAFLHAIEIDQPVNWVFNDDIFNSVDWATEPPGNLDDYYDNRAKEIREQYDYVVLSYSGGGDSHNILMSFYRQGLRIDEIVSNWVVEAAKKFTVIDSNINDAWNCHAEYELHTRARLQWINDNMPDTKITTIDVSRNVINYFKDIKDESWVLNHRDAINPAVTQRYNYLQTKEIRKNVDHYKSIAIITGTDKPKFFISDNKLYFYFADRIANITPVTQHFSEYTNTTIEFFYWSPDATDLLRKQCHIALNFLNTNKQYQKLFDTSSVGGNRSAQEIILRKILYPSTWDSNWFQAQKSSSDWDNELDFWFTDQFKSTKLIRNWELGINFLKNKFENFDLLNKNLPNQRGLKTFNSPLRYIGEIVA